MLLPNLWVKKEGATVVNFLEVQSEGTFEILSGGEVTVDGGASIAKNSALVDDLGVHVKSGGMILNNDQAIFRVKNFDGTEGVGVKNEGNVVNNGTVDISNVTNKGLDNTNVFKNQDCAVFSTDSKIGNSESADITNLGLISSTYGENGGTHENTGDITNEGIIEDAHNAFINIIGNPVVQSGDGETQQLHTIQFINYLFWRICR